MNTSSSATRFARCRCRIEGISTLVNLVQLDLSENRIRRVSGLSLLRSLHTLNLSKNYLEDFESVQHLAECPALTNIDMNNNELKDERVIVEVLGKIPTLVATNLDGNPLVREVGNFRKKMINACKRLRYMDRPVEPNERAGAAAWATGGYEAERKVRQEVSGGVRIVLGFVLFEFTY